MALPNFFQVYRAPKSSSWSKTKTYHLGADDTSPLYTAKETVSWTGKFTITLHPGSTTDGDSIASSSSGSVSQSKASVTVSAPGGSDADGKVDEPFRRHVSLKHETWDFVLAITSGNERHAEKFEWRRSHSDETASLRDGKSTYGWKLVRLHSGESTRTGVQVDDQVIGESSDGKEVVAVWTDDTQTWFRGDEKGVVGKLEFMGSGAASDDSGLGEQWKLFATMSALHMRQVNLQYTQTAANTTVAASA